MNAPTCLCHFINATKTPILLWKHNEKQWILKIADQKFLGHPRLDKRGTVYWKFRNWEEVLLSSSDNSSGPAVVASLQDGEVKVELPSTCADSTCPLNPCPLKENVNQPKNSPRTTQSPNSNCPDPAK